MHILFSILAHVIYKLYLLLWVFQLIVQTHKIERFDSFVSFINKLFSMSYIQLIGPYSDRPQHSALYFFSVNT